MEELSKDDKLRVLKLLLKTLKGAGKEYAGLPILERYVGLCGIIRYKLVDKGLILNDEHYFLKGLFQFQEGSTFDDALMFRNKAWNR